MKQINLKILDTDIHVVDNESTSHHSVIFLHGNSLNASFFEAQIFAPELKDFRLIAFDLPGHGKSGKHDNPEEGYSILGYADIVIGLIKELDLINPVLIGHSLGGHIANYTAYKSPTIKAIGIFGTPPLGFPPAMDQAFLPNPSLAMAFNGDLTEEEAGLLASAFAPNIPALIQLIKESIMSTDPLARECLGASLQAGKMIDEIEFIQSFKQPYAIWHAENDGLVNLEYLRNLKVPNLWNNKVAMISNANHMLQAQEASPFNSQLKAFLDEVFLPVGVM